MKDGGKKAKQKLRKTTGPTKNKSKTKGTKPNGVGSGNARKMGPKSSSGKEPARAGSVSSQTGILNFFGKGTSLVEVGIPKGIGTRIQIPAGKEWNSSVVYRPLSKETKFMTRDLTLEIKISETG